MNPRQRRGVLMLAIAGLGLIGVFVLVAGYVADVNSQIDPKVRVLALTQDARPFEGIDDGMVETIEMPRKFAPRNAIRDPGQLVGVVPASPLPKDTVLQEGMLISPPELEGGQREIAIMVDAETGVAGKIGQGALVDIIATFAGDSEGLAAESRVVVPKARVVEVGQVRPGGEPSVPTHPEGAQELTAQIPVTFALTPKQVLNVTFAESNATEVRLALRRPGDLTDLRKSEKVFRRENFKP
jgi:pilus assembly protein CpaB